MAKGKSAINSDLLPINGRKTFIEIIAFLQEVMGGVFNESSFFLPIRQQLDNAQSNDDRMSALMTVPSQMEDVFSMLKNTASQIDNKKAQLLNDDLLGNLSIYDAPFSEVQDRLLEFFPEYSGAHYDELAEEKFDFGVAFMLCLSIAEFKLYEKKLLEIHSNNYHQIAKDIDDKLFLIVDLYTNIKAGRIARKLLKKKLESGSQRRAGGENSKKEKAPIFYGFIDWVLNLPDSHDFRYPKHAAEYYINEIIKAEKPDLYKKVQDTTARTMTEKLKKYCEENDISHPIA